MNPSAAPLMLCSEGKSFCAGANTPIAAHTAARRRRALVKIRCTSGRPIVPMQKTRRRRDSRSGNWRKDLNSRWSPTSGWRPPTLSLRRELRQDWHPPPASGLTYTLPRLIGVQRSSLMFSRAAGLKVKRRSRGACAINSWTRTTCATPRSRSQRKSPKAHRSRCLSTRAATMRQGLAERRQTADRSRIQGTIPWLFQNRRPSRRRQRSN